jgi:hypothetical protein
MTDTFRQTTQLPIVKRDDEKRIVYGWASVAKKAGVDVRDRQDDLWDMEEMTETAHDFMKNQRVLKQMHAGEQRGFVVESVLFSAELQKALGIDLGMEGWFVGVHVPDDETWSKVQSGELQAFSIGGSGERHVEKGAGKYCKQCKGPCQAEHALYKAGPRPKGAQGPIKTAREFGALAGKAGVTKSELENIISDWDEQEQQACMLGWMEHHEEAGTPATPQEMAVRKAELLEQLLGR